jgi:hypothetical protein
VNDDENSLDGFQIHTRKNSPNAELYGLHGFPLMYFYHGLGQQILQIATHSVENLPNLS